MTNRILDAYEEIRKEKQDSLIMIFKKMQWADIVFVIFFILVLIVMMVALIFEHPIISLLSMPILFIGLLIWMVVSRKNARKRWNDKIKKYNESLDSIKKLLISPEHNLYDKYKIKQLISKFNRDIVQLEKEQELFRKRFNDYTSTYIIPAVAFFAGKLFQNITADEIIALVIIGIFLLVVLKSIGAIMDIIITEIIEGNELERKRSFMKLLQDLLDRDFDIDNDDLVA